MPQVGSTNRLAVKPRSSSADRASASASNRKTDDVTNGSRRFDLSHLRACSVSILMGAKLCIIKTFRRRDPLSVHVACLAVMDANLMLNFIHSLVFSFDGCGLIAFAFLANCMQLMSECIFIILLGLIARGWYFDRPNLPFVKPVRMAVFFGLYLVLNMALEAWSFASRMPIEDIDEYQTTAFIIELALRLFATCCFLYSVWRTTRDGALAQAVGDVQDFFYQFAAGYLVYLIYLPFLVLICVAYVSALWRLKTIMAVRYAMNFLAYACMVHVTWPSRRPAFFIFQKDYECTDDEETSWLSSDSELS